MKFAAILSAAIIATPLPSSATDFDIIETLLEAVPDTLALENCWNGDLSQKLACFESSLERCESSLESLAPVEGGYSCSYQAEIQADVYLNREYQDTIQRVRSLNSDHPFQGEEQAIRDAQRKWLVYRDAQAPLEGDLLAIMSGYDAIKSEHAARLSIAQAHYLSQLLQGF